MNNNLFLLIESYRKTYTNVEQVVADYFLSKQKSLTISDLSKEINVSQASITRFCKKIGLNNYKELTFLYNLSLENDGGEQSVSSSVTATYHALATRSDDRYDEETVARVCELLADTKFIYFWGMGFNSYAGLDFQFKCARLGKFVSVISDEHSTRMSANFCETDELIMVSSLRGNSESLRLSVATAAERGAKIVLITGNPDSELRNYATETLIAASLHKNESLGNISPQIPILIQLDLIFEKYISLQASQKWIETEDILREY